MTLELHSAVLSIVRSRKKQTSIYINVNDRMRLN